MYAIHMVAAEQSRAGIQDGGGGTSQRLLCGNILAGLLAWAQPDGRCAVNFLLTHMCILAYCCVPRHGEDRFAVRTYSHAHLPKSYCSHRGAERARGRAGAVQDSCM